MSKAFLANISTWSTIKEQMVNNATEFHYTCPTRTDISHRTRSFELDPEELCKNYHVTRQRNGTTTTS